MRAKVVLAILYLVLKNSTHSIVHSQPVLLADCDEVTASVKEVSRNSCGCQVDPKCNECLLGAKAVFLKCANGCEYCDKSGAICGTLQKFDIWRTEYDTFFDVYYEIILQQYMWIYSEGLSGDIYYSTTFEVGKYLSTGIDDSYSCQMFVDGASCNSCKLIACKGDNKNNNSQQYEPTIDCTNLEIGATATACSNRTGGGFVSLDESALSGILAPLAYPYLLCERGAAVLGKGEVTYPESFSTYSPKPAPNDDDDDDDTTDKCGLFKLGIFCQCGLIRRLLRLC